MGQPIQLRHLYRNRRSSSSWRQQKQQQQQQQQQLSDNNKNYDIQESSDDENNNLLPNEQQQQPVLLPPTSQVIEEDENDNGNDIISFTKTKPPTNYLEKPNNQQPPNDRLTLLKEPDDYLSAAVSGRQVMPNRMNLSTSAAAADEPSKLSAFTSATAADQRELNSHLNHQMFLLGSSSMLLLILIIAILYNWLYRRRSRAKRGTTSCYQVVVDQHSPLLPSCCGDFGGSSGKWQNREERNRSTSFAEDDAVSANNRKQQQQQQQTGGEHIQLIDRRPQPPEDTIQVINSGSPPTPPPTAAILADGERKLSASNSKVILKRKLAKNSLVVSAKERAKPKVKLIKTQVRKFIDEEAQEIRMKREQELTLAWHSQVVAFFLDKLNLSNMNISDKAQLDVNATATAADIDESELTAINDTSDQPIEMDTCLSAALTTVEPTEEQSTIDVQQDGDNDNRLSVEIHHQQTAVAEEEEQQQQQQQQVVNLLLSEQHKPQLSPSPVAACSSISACSLFADNSSSSPNEQQHLQHLHSSCGCPTLNHLLIDHNHHHHNHHHQAHLKDHYSPASNHLYNSNHQSSDLRSKSQGHSPCQMSTSFRPCCSTSPSTFNSLLTGVVDQQQQQQQRQQCCITPLMLSTTVTSNQTSTIHNLSSNNTAGNGGGIHSGRCSNRIKRQYENYYDDEREDTYRKLSIGINYAAAAAAVAVPLPAPSDNHLEELLSLNRYASSATATCHHHHHLANHQVPQQSAFFAQQQDSHLSSSSAVAAPTAATFSAPMLQQQHSLVARSGCRCCNQPAGSATSGQVNGAVINSAPVAFNEQPFSDVAEQQQQQHLLTRSAFHDQQQHLLFDNKGYLFSRSGSEQLSASSGSTSLGGSDSGFINMSSSLSASRANNNSSNNTCRNPLCRCQLPASHPMSILVQQPSMSTPPPPVAPDLSSITTLGASANSAAQLEPEVPSSGNEPVVAENSSAEVQTTTGIAARPKWKHRRRLSHNHSHHLFSGLQQQQQVHLCNNDLIATRAAPSRRMSIAGDRLTSSQQQRSAPVDSAQSPATTTTVSPLPQHNHQQHHHLPLQHRASVAADGSWGFSRAACSPVLRQYNNSAVNYYRSQNQTPAETASSITNAHQQQHNHRPSDASLYDTSAVSNSSYCSSAAHLSGTCCGSVSNGSACGGKSNHSSSGGSSSGIGISGGGSACTNTPTSCAFPYGSFGTNVSRTDILTGGTGPLTRDSSLYYNQHHHHHHHHNHPLSYHHQYLPPIGGGYLHDTICTDSTCQAASCTTSRKYSLPVQLESHSAERLSPSRSRPLFEKNSLLHQQQQPADLSVNSSSRQAGVLSNGTDQQAASAHCRRGRLSESRRNSQTITRQSSFWLDEDSAVFTLNDDNNNQEDNDDYQPTAIASNLNQQVFLECAEQQQVVAQEAAIVTSQPQPHQRLSTSSIILSADSIESVKLKPKETSSSVKQEDESLPPALVDDKVEVDNSHQVEASRELDSVSAEEEEDEKQKDDDNDDITKRPFKSSPGNAKKTSRLSSTSTSSTNSSPSPDFSACRPPTSERILSSSSKKSSGVSKRNLIGKIRTRRYPHIRLSNRNSAPGESTKSNVPVVESLSSDKIQQTTNVAGKETEQQTNAETPEKQTTEVNSSSLERQCRELWKLRAALHDDSCVGDNWSNYHQRLSRRYDSGYKSIENQLSSSLEGNLLVSSSTGGGNQPPQPARQQSQQQVNTTTDEPQRPQSGCSHLPPPISKAVDDEYNETSSEEQTLLSPTSTTDFEGKTTTTTTTTSHKSKSAEELADQLEQQSSTDTIQGKLADLELDDIALECLISCNTPSDRDCNSRSSKSSSNEDEEKKTKPLRTQCRTPEV